MQRIMFILFSLTLTVISLQQAHAQQPRQNPGLPKVDYAIGRIQPLGQGLAIPVTNRGFVISPNTTVTVAIYDLRTRQLLTSRSLSVPAIRPNQTHRAIIVPPSKGRAIMVRAKVDPGNRVRESNERNNATASQH